MKKVEYINKFLTDKPHIPPYSTFAACLINTLSPKEACMMFDLSFKQNPLIRKAVLRKISHDIEISPINAHKKLISGLLKKVSLPSFPRRDSCAFAITYLYPYLSKEEQESILSLFLTSKYALVRERALKILRQNWDPKYTETIWNMWNKTASETCAKIIIEFFPLEFLKTNYRLILPSVPSWLQRKLLIKIMEKNGAIIAQLKKYDPITYAYLLTKQGKKLSSSQAWKLAQAHYDSPNISLLLWCFGQMGLWNVLIKFEKTYLEKMFVY